MRDETLITPLSRVQDAVRNLVTLTPFGESTSVSVPVVYPSGACAVVEVSFSGHDCFVSDGGVGFLEAEFASAQTYYDHAARSASQHFGVKYDGINVFATWASLDRVDGAIVAVANASVQAVSAAVMRAIADKDRRTNAVLFETITQIFGARHVAKSADIRGQEAEWEAHNVVSLDGNIAIFEFVTNHQNSIANKYQMFSDISRSQTKPSLNSVVRSLPNLGMKGAMLADVSNLLELDAKPDDYRRFARLAA